MAATEPRSRRQGGRAARKALRAAPLPEDKRPVQPGMEGGRFKPLTETEVERVHHAVLDVLENIGLSQAIPSCVELVTNAGGKYTDEGRLLFPRSLVEDTLATCARDITLHAQDPADMLAGACFELDRAVLAQLLRRVDSRYAHGYRPRLL